MNWEIKPLVGLGPLQFSMSPSEVASYLDPLHAVTGREALLDGTMSEFRGILSPVCNYKDNELRCLDTHWLMSPMTLSGEDVYSISGRKLLRKLEVINEGALILYSVIYFIKIGLTACNYTDAEGNVLTIDDDDDDFRGVGVFRYGAFDDVLKGATAITFDP